MEALAAGLKSMGAEITVIPADLSRPGAAAALMESVEQRGLAIDIDGQFKLAGLHCPR